jgi:ADP-ribose pyrophosphatase
VHETIEPLGEQTVFTGRVFDVVAEQLRFATTGRITHHLTVRHPGAVVLLPRQEDGSLLLIKQYRHSVRQKLFELPAGTLEPGEEPLACAQRELAEETGYVATTWQDLGQLHPAPGFCSEVQHCFFATGLSACQAAPDEDEIIEVVPMSATQVEQAIRDGSMTDAKSIALYTRAKLRGLLDT